MIAFESEFDEAKNNDLQPPETGTLPIVAGIIDAEIAPLVFALRRDGFPTTSSCDGTASEETGWLPGLPWVNVAADTMEPPMMQSALLAWCRNHDIKANVCAVRSTFKELAPWVRVEVFSKLSEAKL